MVPGQERAAELDYKLQLILEGMSDGFVLLDREWRFLHVNPAAARYLCKASEELLGKSFWEVFPKAAESPTYGHLRRAMEERVMVEFEEYCVPLEAWYAARCLPTPEGIVAFFRDVTDRKQAEAAVRQLNAELEERVQARTRSLTELTSQLNDFCYSIAHDLKAPIRAQVSFAQLLLARHGAQLDEEGRAYAQRIAEAAVRQGKLVSDLLSHMSLGRTELPLGPVALAQVVEFARADLQWEIEQKGAVLETTAVAGRVLANASSLHLVILNLLSNALKFVPRGARPQVRVRSEVIHREPGPEPTSGIQADAVRLWIADQGIGIPRESQGHLFEVFQRLHTRYEYPGTGMGLAIVKRAVETMGGRVGVVSEEGKGSQFWVELRSA